MNTSKNPEVNLSPGDLIIGKWNQNHYTILRELGSGATGTVYLAKSKQSKVAVKVSHDTLSITSEVNVLKHLSKVQGKTLGPSFVEMDDWRTPKGTFPFYVMEYVQGESLFVFMRQRKEEWFGILILQLLRDLADLHKSGWVFGDLKPDNLLITGPPPKIRWLDVGGTTMMGRAIKEYTEFFDRGYWGMGSRKAEPTYDLFAVAMIIMNFAYPKRFDKKEGGWQQLQKLIDHNRSLKKYRKILYKALHGQYATADAMKDDLLEYYSRKSSSQAIPKKSPTPKPTPKGSTKGRYQRKKSKRKRQITETMLIFLFLLAFYIVYLIGNTV
ncbi:serine/threonine protein kinase [Pseudalkalibacillus berkeleyi]|uniref:Protein kinase n=1 Tax=Pseudalkalibacillus berkeleyi TaxID=1069813 RepID=A0ABS9H657_9BACL|nr:protein kinase [Pseudalkalibacillus berkeleyi]MCF6139606.1 protein kinase [Pseudalkalibacillus berkeleyi]